MKFNEQKIARISIIIIFLALLRCIGEVYRMHMLVSKETPEYMYPPFLFGIVLCGISSMIMTILSFYSKNRLIISLAILTIIALFAIKITMM